MTRHGAAALAGGAGAVGGWLAGRATLGGKAAAPSSPAAAVGGRPGSTGTATGKARPQHRLAALRPAPADPGRRRRSPRPTISPSTASNVGGEDPAATPAAADRRPGDGGVAGCGAVAADGRVLQPGAEQGAAPRTCIRPAPPRRCRFPGRRPSGCSWYAETNGVLGPATDRWVPPAADG